MSGPGRTPPGAPQIPPKIRGGLKGSVIHGIKAIGYALEGLAAGFRLSLAFRQETLALAVLVAALIWRGKSPAEWLMCVAAWLFVMGAELFNTALEETLDLITRDYSLAVKNAKDMASAVIFLGLLANGGVWLYVFGPDVLALLP